MKYLLMVIIAFSSLLTLSCSKVSKLPESFSPVNKLVFIEDIDGRGGLYDGNFGDIVIFDPVTKQKYIITDDEYFNMNTKWAFSGKSIVFDSMRGYDYDPLVALSNSSHLFRIDLRTRNLLQLDLPVYKKKKKDEEVDNRCPVLDSSNTLMAFASYNEVPGKMDLILYSFTKHSFDTLMRNIEDLNDIHWDGDNIAFTYDQGKDRGRGMVIINWKTKEKRQLEKIDWNIDIGDFKKGIVLYIGYELGENTPCHLYAYFVEKDLKIKILTNDSLCFYDPVFARNKTIYLISGIYNFKTGYHFYDIFSYDLMSRETKRITHDKHEKFYLDYYDYPDSLNYLKNLEALIKQ